MHPGHLQLAVVFQFAPSTALFSLRLVLLRCTLCTTMSKTSVFPFLWIWPAIDC